MNIAIVVQRYGADLSGGAELHARYIAEHLARHVHVEILTTCARDYITWRNELAPGRGTVDGLTVHRFPVERERETEEFGARSRRVFEAPHSLADELAWLESEGPASPSLIRYIRQHRSDYDYFLFFSYRYYHAYYGVQAVARQSVLVPTAERDSALGLGIFRAIFRGVRALMYNSPEERAMIEEVADNRAVPGVVVGVGSMLPNRVDPNRFRQKFGIEGPYAIYIGRIDENKGCRELFRFFQQYARTASSRLNLIVVGTAILPVPEHPRIKHMGYLSDQDKFDALAGADVLIMPSYFESLSMVTLEAWGLGRPVLANGRCDVLRGQVVRSGAGLYYETYPEFAGTLRSIETDPSLQATLGRQGQRYYQQHYDWPIVERKYLDILSRLKQEDAEGRQPVEIEPLPGWFARRRTTLSPSQEVVDRLPAGPVLIDDAASGASSR